MNLKYILCIDFINKTVKLTLGKNKKLCSLIVKKRDAYINYFFVENLRMS